jgi:hypothetical protein
VITCEHIELGVPCVRPARCRQRFGARLHLCGWHGKCGVYQPTDLFEEQRRSYHAYPVNAPHRV